MGKSVLTFSSPPEETYGVVETGSISLIRPFTIALYLVIFRLSYDGIEVFSEHILS